MATRCQLFTELLAGFPGELQPQPVLLEGRLCVKTYPHFTQHRIKQKGQKHPQLMDCLVLRFQTWPEDLITTWYGTNILLEAAPFMDPILVKNTSHLPRTRGFRIPQSWVMVTSKLGNVHWPNNLGKPLPALRKQTEDFEDLSSTRTSLTMTAQHQPGLLGI